ncbi:MAG: hypothetical protein ABFR97_09505 [Thermodesulfobacteriota bacterium]
MRIFLLLILLFVSPSGLAAAESPLAAARPEAELAAAADFFQEALAQADPAEAAALFHKALWRYERLYAEYGQPQLAYNIGNTYVHLGELGRAIVNYRRAAARLPGDDNVRHNLAHARSLRQGQHGENGAASALFWSPWRNWLASSDLALRLLAGTYLAFWLVLAAWFRWRRGFWARLTMGLGLLTLVMASALAWQRLRPEPAAGVVVVAELVARQGDGRTYEPSFAEPLADGTEFILLARRDRWLQVELLGGESCWLPARGCELL